MCSWISVFLCHITAIVKLDGSLGRGTRLSDKAPQGNVPSPTLSLLFASSIVNTPHHDSQTPFIPMTWLPGHTSSATHVVQETINKVSYWADEWCMEIACMKTLATLFSFSTAKERVTQNLESMPVPWEDSPSFLGVTLDKRLTWKTHLEAVAARSVRKLGVLKKLAGTTRGADTNILRRVYTGAVRPILVYATTSWNTASNANKSKRDKV